MAQTGQRGSHPVSPRDITGRRSRELLRQKAEREKAASEVIDVSEIRRESYMAGHSAGWDAAIAWVIERMTEIGLDPDILALDDDEHQDDDAGEDA